MLLAPQLMQQVHCEISDAPFQLYPYIWYFSASLAFMSGESDVAKCFGTADPRNLTLLLAPCTTLPIAVSLLPRTVSGCQI